MQCTPAVSLSSRGTLYHMRSANEARQALTTGVFRLNTLHGVEANIHKKAGLSTVKFFMSLTRNKHNDFFRGATKDGKVTSVVYELDGNKLGTKYRISPIAYYDLHARPDKNEMEERLLSSTETIQVKPYLQRIAVIIGSDGEDYSTLVEELLNWGVPVLAYASLKAYLANRQLPIATAPKKVPVVGADAYVGNRRDHAVSPLDAAMDFESNKRPSDMLKLAYALVAEAQNGDMSMSVEMTKAANRLRVKSKLALAMAVVAYWTEREKEYVTAEHAKSQNRPADLDAAQDALFRELDDELFTLAQPEVSQNRPADVDAAQAAFEEALTAINTRTSTPYVDGTFAFDV